MLLAMTEMYWDNM